MSDQTWVLKILSGPHVGAEITLHEGKHSLGRHEECDLVLTDNTLADYQLEIHISDESVEIINLVEEQSIHINGKAQENQFPLEPFAIATAGNLHFAMAPENASWPNLSMPNLAPSTSAKPNIDTPADKTDEDIHEDEYSDEVETEDEVEVEDSPAIIAPVKDDKQATFTAKYLVFIKNMNRILGFRPKKSLLIGGVSALLLIGFIVGFFWLWQLTDPTAAERKKSIPLIVQAETLRISQQLENVTLEALPSGSILLIGYVTNSSTEQAYINVLAEKFIPYNNQIIALDEMQENAKSILKMNGYKTLTVALDTLPGTLILRGYLHTGKDLIKVHALLRQEVNGLRAIIDQMDFQNSRIKALRSMLKSNSLSRRIKLLDQPGKVVINGRLMNISQGYHLKEIIRTFREKYGKYPELVLDVTLPSANMDTMQPVINIKSITIGKEPFIILNNDEKYLKGAKLENGYILEDITLEYLMLRLGRDRMKFHIGGNHARN
ncbi:MAG: type III secretion system inner membrane ring subunit SctD [Endozoicomonadaceae bacterium]|nr:type III secretion system inner membrane ring subunit SctD [Endozoicomonadaceae bacterium]